MRGTVELWGGPKDGQRVPVEKMATPIPVDLLDSGPNIWSPLVVRRGVYTRGTVRVRPGVWRVVMKWTPK